jgi:hypothetical protein
MARFLLECALDGFKRLGPPAKLTAVIPLEEVQQQGGPRVTGRIKGVSEPRKLRAGAEAFNEGSLHGIRACKLVEESLDP